MKRKLYMAVAAILLITVLSVPSVLAADNGNLAPPAAAQDTDTKINLTDAQKNELKQLYQKRFEIEKQVIQKYVDFGVLTKEQADNKLKRMEKIQQKIEQNGFVPRHGKDFGGHGHDKQDNSAKPSDIQNE